MLGIQGDHQFDNASLASQICKAWLDDKSTCDTQMLPDANKCSKEVSANSQTENVKENCASEIQDKHFESGIQVAQPFHLSPLFLKGIQFSLITMTIIIFVRILHQASKTVNGLGAVRC